MYKCFYNKDDEGGQFYINLNTKTGDGEIALKDIAYSDTLLAALKKTLKPVDGVKKRVELVDWNKLTEVLERLGDNNNKTISRHSKGLLKALKL